MAMARRGHHATGIATIGGPEAFLFKWARPAGFVINAEAWKNVYRPKVTNATTILIGHTRYATQNNANRNEAAHPFRIGQVTGAHNGIIRNWIELARQHETGAGKDAWIVDSQAAFALLDKHDKPEDAIKQLDGYWALTWSKGGNLLFTRAEAPLAVAYVADMRSLFWCSEMAPLAAALKKRNLSFDAWDAKQATIYEYDPRKFDAKGSHAERTELTLHRQHTKQDARTSGGKLDSNFAWDDIPGGFSTRRGLTRGDLDAAGTVAKERWRAYEAQGYPNAANPGDDGRQPRRDRRKGHKHHGVAERTEDMDTSAGVSLLGLARVVRRLANRVTECELQIDTLQQENAALYEMLGADAAASVPDSEVCDTCKRGEEAGLLLPTGVGFVHESCVMLNA